MNAHAPAEEVGAYSQTRLVAWLVCERNRLVLQVEALRIENERLRDEWLDLASKKSLREQVCHLDSELNGDMR